MDDPFLAAFLPVLMFVALFVLLAFGLRRRHCPGCGRPLSRIQWLFTKTWRQWVEGGYRCRTCGCETNLAGEKVVPGTGPQPGSVVQGVLLVLLPSVVGAILLVFLLSPGTREAPLLPAAAPALSAPPPLVPPPTAEPGRR